MDTALTSKPSAPVAAATFVRPDAQPVREAVQTELAAPKAVTAVTNAASSNATSSNEVAQRAAPFTREILIDPQSREVIFRVVDVRSRQVVRQVPDEALLRMRAYTRAIADGKTPTEAQNMADHKV
jgi:uncharacterized FlaG/YvyC family protein